MFRSGFKLLCMLMAVIIAVSLIAQEEQPAQEDQPAQQDTDASGGDGLSEAQLDPASEYSTADRPEDNYLARFHALERIQELEKSNLDKIFTLNVIKENFKEDYPDWENTYDDVYEGYKSAMDLYYRRKVIYAAVKLEENKKHINEFYKTVSDQYREDALDMLNLCADNILQLSLMASTVSNPNSSRKLFNQITRLRVAYGQMDKASEARVRRLYWVSVQHYRVAKSYAIAILEDINPEEYYGNYQVHKADNLNRIYAGETTASEVVDREEEIQRENERNAQPEEF
ncbi:MAG: hypothetical protein ACOCWH_03395 [Spirochaetota bacterium]